MDKLEKRLMAKLRERFHRFNQCLFWVGPILDGLNLQKGPAVSRRALHREIDALEERGIVKWIVELVCEECGNGTWRGLPSKAPKNCRDCFEEYVCYDPTDPYDKTQFELDRAWAEARKWE